MKEQWNTDNRVAAVQFLFACSSLQNGRQRCDIRPWLLRKDKPEVSMGKIEGGRGAGNGGRLHKFGGVGDGSGYGK